MSNHGESFLFRVLESTNQQQEILLLVNESFPKALCSQIVQVQFLHLMGRQSEDQETKTPAQRTLFLTEPAQCTGTVSCSSQKETKRDCNSRDQSPCTSVSAS